MKKKDWKYMPNKIKEISNKMTYAQTGYIKLQDGKILMDKEDEKMVRIRSEAFYEKK